MRIYTLQIHFDKGTYFDDIYSFEDFQDLVREYNRKLDYYKKMGCVIKAKEEPTLDEVEDGAHGMFVFENADGTMTSARVYDYDVM